MNLKSERGVAVDFVGGRRINAINSVRWPYRGGISPRQVSAITANTAFHGSSRRRTLDPRSFNKLLACGIHAESLLQLGEVCIPVGQQGVGVHKSLAQAFHGAFVHQRSTIRLKPARSSATGDHVDFHELERDHAADIPARVSRSIKQKCPLMTYHTMN